MSDLTLPAITRGQYRVVHNGAENYVMEWLDADGKPTGTARPATPQEYEMFCSLDIAVSGLKSALETNERIQRDLATISKRLDRITELQAKARESEREMHAPQRPQEVKQWPGGQLDVKAPKHVTVRLDDYRPEADHG